MNAQTFNDILDDRINHLKVTLSVKGAEYSDLDDCLKNFREAAGYIGTTMSFVCWMYLLKHLTSLKEMCASELSYPFARWNEKIGDSIAYLVLLYAIVSEDHGEQERTDRGQDSGIQEDNAPEPGIVWSRSPSTTYQR
jgi:hypothetical protein